MSGQACVALSSSVWGGPVVRIASLLAGICVIVIGLLVGPSATFSGKNGLITFARFDGKHVEIFSANPDGSHIKG